MITKTQSAQIVGIIVITIIVYGIIATLISTAIIVCFVIIFLYLGMVNIPRLFRKGTNES